MLQDVSFILGFHEGQLSWKAGENCAHTPANDLLQSLRKGKFLLVEGRIFWDATFPSVPHAERSAYFDAMNETISRLHAIDQLAVGLGDYGKPGDYFARQIGRWSKQYLADDLAGRAIERDGVQHLKPAEALADVGHDQRAAMRLRRRDGLLRWVSLWHDTLPSEETAPLSYCFFGLIIRPS